MSSTPPSSYATDVAFCQGRATFVALAVGLLLLVVLAAYVGARFTCWKWRTNPTAAGQASIGASSANLLTRLL